MVSLMILLCRQDLSLHYTEVRFDSFLSGNKINNQELLKEVKVESMRNFAHAIKYNLVVDLKNYDFYCLSLNPR